VSTVEAKQSQSILQQEMLSCSYPTSTQPVRESVNSIKLVTALTQP
jgi:hypothetical protein